MKDFEITGYPHIHPNMMIGIAGVLLILIVMIFFRRILENYMIIIMLCVLAFIIFTMISQFATGKNPIFLHDYKGAFQVAQVKTVNTEGSDSDNKVVILENKKGQQQAFSMKKQHGHKGGIKKGDKVVLRVRMNDDKKPVWTKNINQQGGNVISIKKLINT